MQPTSNDRVVTLFESDNDTRVIIQDRKHHISPYTVSELVNATRMATKAGEVQHQFQDLLEHLSKWIERNQDVLKSASVAIRSEGLLFLVIQKTTAYDDNLSDMLTDLDVEIARDQRFNLLRVNTLALPLCSRDDIEQFFETAGIDHA